MEVPRVEGESELQLQPQQRQIRATSATYTIAHGKAGSFNPLGKARD